VKAVQEGRGQSEAKGGGFVKQVGFNTLGIPMPLNDLEGHFCCLKPFYLMPGVKE